MRARVAYFLSLCTLLALVQLRGLIGQLELGYRPFGKAPQRVAFSWDMFAVDLERCAVTWDPPLSVGGKRVARWQDRGAPLEWDMVMYAASYERVAKEACKYKTSPRTTVKLACPRTNGEVRETAFDCP